MIYKVQARFNQSKAKEFYKKFTDGTIENQRPDGPEIIASMNRATIDSSGLVYWTELCYCPTPLRHERVTVYDQYFSDLKTKQIENHEKLEGALFINDLSKLK